MLLLLLLLLLLTYFAAFQHRLHQDAQDGVDDAGVHPLPLRDAAQLGHRQVRGGRDVRRPGQRDEAGIVCSRTGNLPGAAGHPQVSPVSHLGSGSSSKVAELVPFPQIAVNSMFLSEHHSEKRGRGRGRGREAWRRADLNIRALLFLFLLLPDVYVRLLVLPSFPWW